MLLFKKALVLADLKLTFLLTISFSLLIILNKTVARPAIYTHTYMDRLYMTTKRYLQQGKRNMENPKDAWNLTMH